MAYSTYREGVDNASYAHRNDSPARLRSVLRDYERIYRHDKDPYRRGMRDAVRRLILERDRGVQSRWRARKRRANPRRRRRNPRRKGISLLLLGAIGVGVYFFWKSRQAQAATKNLTVKTPEGESLTATEVPTGVAMDGFGTYYRVR